MTRGTRRMAALLVAAIFIFPTVTWVPFAGSSGNAYLASRLLSQSQLPSGWTSTAQPVKPQAATCGLRLTGKGAPPTSESVAFVDPSLHAKLSEVLAAGTNVQRRWQPVLAHFRHCRSVTATVGAGQRRAPLSFVSLTTIGTRSVSLRFLAQAGGTTLVATFVVFEAKQFVGVITFSTEATPTPATVEGLAKLAEAKAVTGVTMAQLAPKTTATTTTGP